MARFAILNADLVVVNVVAADAAWVAANAPDAVRLTGQDNRVGPGWRRVGQDWAEPDEPAEVVPQTITRRQLRRALLAADLLTQMNAALETWAEPRRSRARIDWQDGAEFERDDRTVKGLANDLGITSNQLDLIFIAASRF